MIEEEPEKTKDPFAAFDFSDEDFDLSPEGDEAEAVATETAAPDEDGIFSEQENSADESTGAEPPLPDNGKDDDFSFFDDLGFDLEEKDEIKKKVAPNKEDIFSNIREKLSPTDEEILRDEVRELLEHIERVLKEIPQDRIEEFTRSSEYRAYQNLFSEPERQ